MAIQLKSCNKPKKVKSLLCQKKKNLAFTFYYI